MKTCSRCETWFSPSQHVQKYCSPECRRAANNTRDTARGRAEVRAARVGRVCADCKISIEDRMITAQRCAPCGKKHAHRETIERRKQSRSREREFSAKKPVTPSRTGLKRHDPSKLAPPPKTQPPSKLPDLGSGEGFEGWDGCWSPNVTPDTRALIARHLGLPDPMKQGRGDEAA